MVRKGGKPSRNPIRNVSKNAAKACKDAVPSVFRSLLAEVNHEEPHSKEERPLKRRKIGAAATSLVNGAAQLARPENTVLNATPKKPSLSPSEYAQEAFLQTVVDYSEESEESGSDWEEIVLGHGNESEYDESQKGTDAVIGRDSELSHDEVREEELKDISIVIGDRKPSAQAKNTVKRRVVTATDRKLRLNIHKMHLLCLLYHCYVRNSWCNDRVSQSKLKTTLPLATIKSLHPDPDTSQSQATKEFGDALHHVKVVWKDKFDVSALGMCRPSWEPEVEALRNFSLPREGDDPLERADFRKAASALKGSQDIGAQLLCCLFRSIGIQARLVCSLQCLPFASAAEATTPQRPKSEKRIVHADEGGLSSESDSPRKLAQNPSSSKKSREVDTTPSIIRRITGMPRGRDRRNRPMDLGKAPKSLLSQKNSKHRQQYPVFWVEVFSAFAQKWVPIDPLATFTVDRPSAFEPPLNYPQNGLYYVIAFESDGYAKDITQRYAKWFNAKTRQGRVECTEGGEVWWKKALKLFRRRTPLDRDQMEDAALARKTAAEPMPRNVQDFKKHPIYVLERHLGRNEVLSPRQEVGKVNIGPSSSGTIEPVFRRRDVHIVRSADKWYRLGREVKHGEQPLKRSSARRRRATSEGEQGPEGEDSAAVPLYAIYQTELYVPPPVVRGRVPRNAFGNLDIYVPSMVPKGAVHIHSADAARAARVIGADFAEAVTGFQFKGRHGTAIVQGAIVAEEYAAAIKETIAKMARARVDEEREARSREALRLWRKFMRGLWIVERVNEYATGEEDANIQEEIDEGDRRDEDNESEEDGGGFFPNADAEAAEPTASKFEPNDNYHADSGGGFVPENASEDEGESVQEDDNLEEVSVSEERENNEASAEHPNTFGSTLLANRPQRFPPPTQMKRFESISIPYGFNTDGTSRSGLYSRHFESKIDRSDNSDNTCIVDQIGDNEEKETKLDRILDKGTNMPNKDADGGVERIDADKSGVSEGELPTILSKDITVDTSKRVEIISGNLLENTELEIAAKSDSDANSLLSHDPEDEDAEPEWIFAEDDI